MPEEATKAPPDVGQIVRWLKGGAGGLVTAAAAAALWANSTTGELAALRTAGSQQSQTVQKLQIVADQRLERITSLEAAMGRAEQRLERLATLEAALARISTIEAAQVGQSEAFRGLDARLTRIETKLDRVLERGLDGR